MKIGYSMVFQEHVPCEDVGYGDCKEFQVVCPACKGAVYKTGSIDAERQFLSHHPGTGHEDCELRVSKMMSTLQTGTGSEERNQSLKAFQAKLLENYIEYRTLPRHPKERRPEVKKSMEEEFYAALSRPTYQRYLKTLRNGHARSLIEKFGDVLDEMNRSANDNDKANVVMQSAYISDFMEHIKSDRAGKVFLNITTLALLNAGGRGSTQVHPEYSEKMHNLRMAFAYGNEKEFKRAYKTAKKWHVMAEGQHTTGLYLIDHDLMTGILATLTDYPFVETKLDLAA